jgi:sRNA-binding protein
MTIPIELLCRMFPRMFFRAESERRPLKRRIHLDILRRLRALTPTAVAAADDPDVAADVAAVVTDPANIRHTLKCYVSAPGYLAALVAGVNGPRIDLDGQPAGFVGEREAKCAAAQLQPQPAPAKPKPKPPAQVPKPPPPPPQPAAQPQRLSLADLKAAAQRRRGG